MRLAIPDIDTAESTAVFHSHAPADGVVIASFPDMDSATVDDVVAHARSAADRWAAGGAVQRKRALSAWAGELSRVSSDLSELVHRENGKPRDDAFMELVIALEHIDWAAHHAARVLAPRRVSAGILMANFGARIQHEPFGVVGVISPWNYPVFAPIAPIASALAAGNTVVLKPSEYATGAAREIVDAFRRANPGLDPAVLSLVTGRGTTGAALVASDIDKLEFTGSPRIGRIIGAACAETFTPVVMECGGKDALIVAADADVEAAADAAAWGGFSNGGQTCVGVERVYVDRTVSERFMEALTVRLKDAHAGTAGSCTYGPMTLEAQSEVVRLHVDAAVAGGATTPLGGIERINGRLIDPIVLLGADESGPAVQEETFGPTVTVKIVESIEEAIARANGTEFGLGAAVYSRSDGHRIADKLRCGMVSINSVLAFVSIPALPFGGIGSSGYGRIHGAEGLLEFSRTKSVAVKRFGIPGMNGMLLDRAAITIPVLKIMTRLRYSWRRGGIA
ncbi:aldehyde dehydrogenase [Rhodococcus sp. 15-725-2-2b]|uniref:aldehyde dehydrogenase family protein n=1 Tax=unclassified Rhodococcus (in: high G+C Gram-positive bacteria) TaxID=192944 RepID=UPI000B9B6EFF|nr:MULTISPECIES: aldehyde dehydrogenase family protein [unclassified Rhodococcus (in: high G+C Gram-positive bacteria)]OZC63659.1 aldehyde dehydrogenase [Rhodococcus sp. 06-469-3-2]OZD40824.1 aldehyde dehydrogenase [Rhodococcus sp. 06-1477-1A]OZE67068.1 aldehyde dehydrogenase [Rhodococcus sp. 15-725-2-2b]